MRIVYSLVEDITISSGGPLHFQAVTDNLRKQGHEVFVMVGQYGLGRKLRRMLGRHKILIPLPPIKWMFLLFQCLAALAFPLVYLLHRPDVLLIRGAMGGGFSFLAFIARILGVQVVVEMNGITWAELQSRGKGTWAQALSHWTTCLLCKAAHRIISVTPDIGEELARASGVSRRRIYAIQNGATPQNYTRADRQTVREKLNIDDDALVIGFIGSFDPWHAIEPLIQSVAHLDPRTRSRVKYLLIGNDGILNEYGELINEYKENFICTGYINHREVNSYLSAFDAGVFLTTDPAKKAYGTSPLKFWEYLAAELPVLVSADSNLTPLVETFNLGWVLKESSPTEIAKAIEELYAQRDSLTEMGMQNRAIVSKHFSWKKTAERVARVLEGTEWGDENCHELRCGPIKEI